MTNLVDLHHHLLPGLDDGPSAMEQTIMMLHRAYDQGVRRIAATPHAVPGSAPLCPGRQQEAFAMVQSYIRDSGLPIRLDQGAELFYSHAALNRLEQGMIPSLGSGWHVLVEFHPSVSFQTMESAMERIGNTGRSVVIAHAERYRCLRSIGRLQALHDLPHVSVQLNADLFLRRLPLLTRHWLREVMKHGLADVVASDAHDVTLRPCRLGDAYRAICDAWGEEAAVRLCCDNPAAILDAHRAVRTID